jgi:hypothetical protein
MSDDEWTGDVITVPTKTYLRNFDASISVTAMNDDRYFYLAMLVSPPSDITPQSSNYRLLGIYMDTNHDGVLNENADLTAVGEYTYNEGHVAPYRGSGFKQDLTESVGWTGSGWIYEAKMPFTLDNGYTWARPGDDIGFAVDWITFQSGGYQASVIYGYPGTYYYNSAEQIIVPPDSVYHYTDMNLNNPGLKTTVPNRFLDIALAGSESDVRSTVVNTGTTEETPGQDEGESTSLVEPDLGLGLYLAVGIAVAGGAIAGAIALTRRKSPSKTTSQ